jgi:hypothetical protein
MMNLHDEIAETAYELFVARGCVHGCDLDDWLNAERFVLARHAGQEIEEPEDVDVLEEIADMEKERMEEATLVKQIGKRAARAQSRN